MAESLIFAALAVLGTLLLFLHPFSVFINAVGIASIDGALFFFIHLLEIPVDAISFLCLVMSISLSVDYVVHVAHAYETSTDGEWETQLQRRDCVTERIRSALSGTGRSVTKGRISTFTGIIVLAFAPSKIFRVWVSIFPGFRYACKSLYHWRWG